MASKRYSGVETVEILMKLQALLT